MISKKKRSSRKLRRNFRPKSEKNSFAFSAQKQVISKKNKKKVFAEIETEFSAEIRNSNAFSGRITTPILRNFGNQFPLRGLIFYFFTQNRPQKHQKRAILHTLQATGYATGLFDGRPKQFNTIISYNCNSTRILQPQSKQSRIFSLNVTLLKRSLQDSYCS